MPFETVQSKPLFLLYQTRSVAHLEQWHGWKHVEVAEQTIGQQITSSLDGLGTAQELLAYGRDLIASFTQNDSRIAKAIRGHLVLSAVRLLDLWKDKHDPLQLTSPINRHLQMVKANMLEGFYSHSFFPAKDSNRVSLVRELERAFSTAMAAIATERKKTLPPNFFGRVRDYIQFDSPENDAEIRAVPSELFALLLLLFSHAMSSDQLDKMVEHPEALCRVAHERKSRKKKPGDNGYSVWFPHLDEPGFLGNWLKDLDSLERLGWLRVNRKSAGVEFHFTE